jgi:hypothetical protein
MMEEGVGEGESMMREEDEGGEGGKETTKNEVAFLYQPFCISPLSRFHSLLSLFSPVRHSLSPVARGRV